MLERRFAQGTDEAFNQWQREHRVASKRQRDRLSRPATRDLRIRKKRDEH